jgi:hypothetical protein
MMTIQGLGAFNKQGRVCDAALTEEISTAFLEVFSNINCFWPNYLRFYKMLEKNTKGVDAARFFLPLYTAVAGYHPG